MYETTPAWQSPDFLWPSPAKINLFLHIIGRRPDGYHLLQTAFQFLDKYDYLQFRITKKSNKINRAIGNDTVPEHQDLVVKAALKLQRHTQCTLGVEISMQKNLPIGGGLGGGSSNAATTLIALNKLWGTNVDTQTLSKLGLTLGADIPVFVNGQAAWAEGVGEELTNISPSQSWYLVIAPHAHVNTAAIFSCSELTRNQQPITIRDFLAGQGQNICQPVVVDRYPAVAKAIDWLSQCASPRMTGTGACVFAAFDTQVQAQHIASQVPESWHHFVAKGLNINPVIEIF